MPESLKTRVTRWGFNVFPAYRGTGGRITYIAADWREVRVKIPLSWRTRNYVGTIFGGSLYGAVDPIYMIMLMKVLGPDYVVWDKAASIVFRKPGRNTLYARFVLDEQEIERIRVGLGSAPKLDLVFTVEVTDVHGAVHSVIEKTVQVRRRDLTAQTRSGGAAERGAP